MSEKRSKLKVGCLSLVALCAIVLVALLLAIRTDWFLNIVRQEVVEIANESLDAKLSVESITGSPYGDLTVEGVSLTGADGKPIATVQRMDVTYELMPLLNGQLVVNSVAVDGAEASVLLDENGELNLAKITKPQPEKPPSDPTEFEIILESITVSNSDAVYADLTYEPAASFAYSPKEAGEKIAMTTSEDVAKAVAINGLNVKGAGAIDLAGDMVFNVETLESNAAVAHTLRAPLKAQKVKVVIKEDGGIAAEIKALSVDGNVALSDTRATLSPELDYVASTALSSDSSGLNDVLKRLEVPVTLVENISAKLAAKGNATQADVQLDASTENGGSVALSAQLAGFDDIPNLNYLGRLETKKLSVKQWVEEVPVATDATVLLTFEGKGIDPLTLDADASVGVFDTTIDNYVIQRAYLEVSKKGNNVTVPWFGLDSPYANLAGSAELRDDASFEASLTAQSSGELPERLKKVLKSKTKVDADLKASGQLDLTKTGLGLVEKLSIDAKWDIDEFQMEDIRIDNSKGDVKASIRPGDKQRLVNWDVDASGRNLKAKTASVRSFDVKSTGSAVIDTRFPADAFDLIKSGSTRINARASGVRAPGLSLSSARVQGKVDRLSGQRAVKADLSTSVNGLRHAESKTTVGNLSATVAGSAAVDRGYRPTRLDADFTANAEDVDAAGIKLQTAAVAGDVRGPIDKLQGDATVVGTKIPLEPYNFETLKADLKLLEDRKFRVEAEGTQTDRKPEDIKLTVDGSYQRDLSGFEIESVSAKTSGEAWVISNGVSTAPDGTVSFNKLELTHQEASIKVDGTYKPGKRQDLEVKLNNFAIDDVGRDFGIEPLTQVSGKSSGDLTVKGTAEEPIMQFNLVLEDFYIQGVGPFRIELIGTYEDEFLSLQTLDVTSRKVRILEGSGLIPCRITTNGEFKIFWDRDTTLDVEISKLQIAEVRSLQPKLEAYQPDGVLSGELLFHGTLDAPSVDVELDLQDLSMITPDESGEQTVDGLDAGFHVTYEPPRAGAGGFKIVGRVQDRYGQGVDLQASSSGALAEWIRDIYDGKSTDELVDKIGSNSFRLHMVLPGYDIKKLELTGARQASAEGTVEMFVTGSGTFMNPSIDAVLQLKDFGWDRFRDINFDTRLTVQEQELKVTKLRMEWDADEILTATATLPLPFKILAEEIALEDLPLRANIDFKPLPISKLSAVDYTFASISGTMQGNLRLQGSVSKPQAEASFQIKKLLLANRSQGDLTATVRAGDDKIRAKVTASSQASKPLEVSMGFPLNLDLSTLGSEERVWIPEGDLSGYIRSEGTKLSSLMPAKLLDGTITQVDGELNADITLAGTVMQPASKGPITIKGFKALLPTLGRTFEDGSFHMMFEHGGIDIVEFFIAENQGYVDIDGRIDGSLLAPTSANLNVAVKEIGTSGFTPLPTYVTANAKVSADLTAQEQLLNIGVRDLEVIIPDVGQENALPTELHGDIKVLTPKERQEKMVMRAGIGEFAKARDTLLKLQLNIQPGWIRHANANIQLKGDLAIEAGGSESTIVGTVETLKGELEVLSKRFKVKSGLITFRGESPPNPRLQFEADYIYSRNVADELGPAATGSPRATVRVTGTALDPKLRMYSDPTLEESEIVYVLVTDRAPATATSGEEEGVSSGAMAAASGLLSGLIQRRASQIYPVDMLRLDTDDSGISGLEVGKYFGADLFFAYEVQFAPDEDENRNSVRVEYQFAPRWLVGTRFGDAGNGSVFLFWRVL